MVKNKHKKSGKVEEFTNSEMGKSTLDNGIAVKCMDLANSTTRAKSSDMKVSSKKVYFMAMESSMLRSKLRKERRKLTRNTWNFTKEIGSDTKGAMRTMLKVELEGLSLRKDNGEAISKKTNLTEKEYSCLLQGWKQKDSGKKVNLL